MKILILKQPALLHRENVLMRVTILLENGKMSRLEEEKKNILFLLLICNFIMTLGDKVFTQQR